MRGKLKHLSSGMKVSFEASMRPAHCAREVPFASIFRMLSIACFNEARALCAGSSPTALGDEVNPKRLQ